MVYRQSIWRLVLKNVERIRFRHRVISSVCNNITRLAPSSPPHSRNLQVTSCTSIVFHSRSNNKYIEKKNKGEESQLSEYKHYQLQNHSTGRDEPNTGKNKLSNRI